MTKAFMITDKSNELQGVISAVDENTVLIEWADERSEELTNEELSSLLESDDYDVEEVEVNEDGDVETAAMQTIHTHSVADQEDNGGQADGNPKTKIDWIRAIVGNLADLDVNTLTRIFDDQQAMIGGEGDRAGLGANAPKNQDSIDMKPSGAVGSAQGFNTYREDVNIKLEKEEQDAIFAESTLTEEAKEKMTTLFESAVALRLSQEIVKLQEKYDALLEKNIEEMSETLVNGIDTFCNHVAAEFIEKNQLTAESTLRTELTNEFINGLKNLFNEHYIDIPEDKVDVLESIVAENEDLKNQLNDKINEDIAKDKIIADLKKNDVLNTMSEGLTLIQKGKLKTATDSTIFENEDSFKKKVQVIKEGFIREKSKESNIITETIEDDKDNKQEVEINPSIAAVASKL